jgi:hypothetical protein
VTNVGDFATLYLDGVAVSSGSVPIDTPPDTQFYIGKIPGYLGQARRLNGLVDEVGIYDRALSADEILAIYDAGSTGKLKPPSAAPPAVDEPATVALLLAGLLSMTAVCILWFRRRWCQCR